MKPQNEERAGRQPDALETPTVAKGGDTGADVQDGLSEINNTKHLVTYFMDKNATCKREEQLTLPQLCGRILVARASAKDKLPWLKFAVFGLRRTKLGSLRHNDNVLAISGVEMDYDGEKISFDDAVDWLQRSRVRGLVYTTPSHTAAAPRWRVLLPASKQLQPDRHAELVSRAQQLFCGIFARESFTLSQAFLYGCVNTNPAHQAVVVDGGFIDARNDLACAALPIRAHNTEPQAPIEDLAIWMRGIPNFDNLSWLDWNDIGMALFAASGGSDAGLALFHEWSSRSAKYNERETSRRWAHFHRSPPTKIGAGTLFFWWSHFVDARDRAYDPAGEEITP